MPLKRAFVLGLSGASQLAQSFSIHNNLRLSIKRAGNPARTPTGTVVAVRANSDYLSSLSSASELEISDEFPAPAPGQQDEEDIPDDHYSKDHPNAGWRGYANPHWGGYLDALPSNCLQEGKKSDYSDDVRWGAEVYLNSIEDGGGS